MEEIQRALNIALTNVAMRSLSARDEVCLDEQWLTGWIANNGTVQKVSWFCPLLDDTAFQLARLLCHCLRWAAQLVPYLRESGSYRLHFFFRLLRGRHHKGLQHA